MLQIKETTRPTDSTVGAALILIAAIGSALAFEQPSIGEVMGERMAEVIDSARAYAAEKQALEFRIQAARTRFFALHPDKEGIEQAENELADLLFVKDVHYLSLFLVEGASPDAKRRAMGMNALTGGELDGGSHEGAWVSFTKWVDAVRKPLGGDTPGQKILVWSEKKLMDAIEASAPAYERYKVERDTIEFAIAGLEQPNAKSNPPRTPTAADVALWEKQCNIEEDIKPAGAARRTFCRCVVDGLRQLADASPLSSGTQEALAHSFLASLSLVEKETGMASAYTARCFR